jgi:hypothetical protein
MPVTIEFHHHPKERRIMRRLSCTLVAAAVVVTGLHNVAAAQEVTIPDEIIKELDGLVGTWKSEGKLGGEEQTGGFTCRWGRSEDKKKVCLIGHFSYTTGDEVRSGVTLIGWNAAKKCIEDRGFDVLGGNATLLWTVESPKLWRGDVTIVENGETITAKADLVKKSPTEIVYEAEMDNGDTARVVFRKVKGARKKKAK